MKLWMALALVACGKVDDTAPAATTPAEPTDTASFTPPDTPAESVTVGGELTGLQGASVTLALAEQTVELTADGPFAFTVDAGSAYEIAVVTQPLGPDQSCTIDGASGTANADVTDVAVRCVTPIRHVVIVGVDGMGGVWVEEANTPVLDDLRAQGVSTLTMQNALPTSSSPNWMSMITGSGPDQHGVTSNDWDPGDSDPPPTLFLALRAVDPVAKIGVFHDWSDFGRLVEDGVPSQILAPGDEIETMAAAMAFLDEAPALTFIHLDHVDHAGHGSTWGSGPYIDAIGEADALIGSLIDALKDRDMWSYTALIVSADHGGEGYSHGGDTLEERAVPFVVVAPQLEPGTIDREVRIWDVAPTALGLLGVEPPAEWIASAMPEVLGGPEVSPPPAADLIEVSDYTWVYDDSGTGAATDVSIWRPVVPDGWAMLGDVAHASHDAPTSSTLSVFDDPALVQPPTGYESVWTDSGSGGTHDLTLYHPIPPAGFVCLGSVAVAAYDSPPSTDLVRCVHAAALDPGTATYTWDDSGSGAYADVSLWTCSGMPGSFISRQNSSDPGSNRCFEL
jgi:hypothetical protein